MMRALIMQTLPFEVRAHHGRFITETERTVDAGLRARRLVRKVYAAVQGVR